MTRSLLPQPRLKNGSGSQCELLQLTSSSSGTRAEPHKWPLTVAAEIWEELHWRFLEELKEILRLLKKEANRETMKLPDIKFYALLPNTSGQAWLELPRTLDLRNPQRWFAAEVVPRIERRQERMLWRLTWEGGPKLTNEEVNKAKDRAPTDGDGNFAMLGSSDSYGLCQSELQEIPRRPA